MKAKETREKMKKSEIDNMRLGLVEAKEEGRNQQESVSEAKKRNVRKRIHLSVLDKMKGLSSEADAGEKRKREIALRLWLSSTTKPVQRVKGVSVQIVNKGKRKNDRGVEFVNEVNKERTGSYIRVGWKDSVGRREVNKALNELESQASQGDEPNWKRMGRGIKVMEGEKEKRMWLNKNIRTENQVREIRGGRCRLPSMNSAKSDGKGIYVQLKEMYRRVLMKGVLMQMWSMMLMRGKLMEKEEKEKQSEVVMK